jgi:hypothetical protein
MWGGLMNFISSFHKKAYGSFAAICLFSAATCAFITFSAAKQGDGSFVLNKTNEPSPCLISTSIKNNSSNTVISSSKTGKNIFYQTSKSLADLAYHYATSISRPLNIFFYNRICRLQDNGLISIRKIE